jgi:hypothetical protein
MQLEHLIPHLDAEIDRLQRARDLLAFVPSKKELAESFGGITLRRVSAYAPERDAAPAKQELQTTEPAAAAAPVRPEVQIHVVRKRRAYTRKEHSSRKRHAVVEDTALRGPVPTGPVVVSAEEVRKAQASKIEQAGKAAESKRTGGDLVSSFSWRSRSSDGRSVDSMLQRLINLGEENTQPGALGDLPAIAHRDVFKPGHQPLVSKHR